MNIIVHAMVGDGAIRDSLGLDDYSYYFVRCFFQDALERFAHVTVVSDPATEVDPLYDAFVAAGEDCLFLSFAPPQKTVLGLRCPVVPVFAWEFGTIPNEVWSDDIRNDWRSVFAVSHGAIALSSYTARIVKASMGEDYPVVAIPAPLFERFRQQHRRDVSERALLRIAGTVLDTDRSEQFRAAPSWPRQTVPLLTPGPLPPLIHPVPVRTADASPVEDGGAAGPVIDATIADHPALLPIAIAAPAAVPTPTRIGWRDRSRITRHLALEWYRLVLRDLLPRPVRQANALAGRALHRRSRRLRRVDAALACMVPPQERLPETLPTPLLPAAGEPGTPLPVAIAAPARVGPATLMSRVALEGVVFVSVFSPRDGRKNWNDIVTAFCWAMRDVPDATLVLKIVAVDREYEQGLRQLLGELAPLRCRVVVLHGFLEPPDYRALIAAASSYVNASHCEGLCLPMLEFMSAGTPAIAPGHTAFEDYVTPANAFVIPSGIENTVWPIDGRDLFRTTRYRIDWHALMQFYRQAYDVAKQEPERYASMSCDARETMARFCGAEPVTEALRRFLCGGAGELLERAA